MSLIPAERRQAITQDILSMEESYRDAVIKAEQERYSKLRDVVKKLLSVDLQRSDTTPPEDLTTSSK
jgi:hypothetical protein